MRTTWDAAVHILLSHADRGLLEHIAEVGLGLIAIAAVVDILLQRGKRE